MPQLWLYGNVIFSLVPYNLIIRVQLKIISLVQIPSSSPTKTASITNAVAFTNIEARILTH
ncbi:MAG: hypothetical protein H0W58_08500 [Acidobacteria bacterium]|nr:hypothetical protein [Acidobacteriota bacterium]